jgi:prefoldin alpha subunit
MSKDSEHKHEHEHEHEHEEEERALMAQLMQQQVAEIEEQVAQIDAKKLELQTVLDSINDLKKHTDADMLVPIGSGVLVKAGLKDGETFLVNVGANIIVEKTSAEAHNAVMVQMGELDRAREMFMKELGKLVV